MMADDERMTSGKGKVIDIFEGSVCVRSGKMMGTQSDVAGVVCDENDLTHDARQIGIYRNLCNSVNKPIISNATQGKKQAATRESNPMLHVCVCVCGTTHVSTSTLTHHVKMSPSSVIIIGVVVYRVIMSFQNLTEYRTKKNHEDRTTSTLRVHMFD